MGEITRPLPVKLFVAVLTSISEIMPAAEERLSAAYGAIDIKSGPFPFEWTRYYDRSMGSPISRYFLGFENLIKPESIADIKAATNELESSFSSEWTTVPRPINLDPGYIEESKLVLASTKNFFHRIYIARGIYAEATLHYQKKGAWRAFPWTFPDYAADSYHEYFLSLRDRYREQLNRHSFRRCR
ncbi:MAG: DUF4416 family protein [Acidobacteria bacterium]|nr:DUF4416 family protein [Acidobacteriota bacterium]